MIPLLVTLTQAKPEPDRISIDLFSPSEIVAGLPLVVTGTVRNDGNSEVSIDLGPNRAGWLTVRILDRLGRVVTESRPDIPLPTRNQPDHSFSLGPRIEPKKMAKLRLSVRMNTSQLKEGEYTINFKVGLPTARGMGELLRENSHTLTQFATRSKIIVRCSPGEVEARAAQLLESVLRPIPKRSIDSEDIRDLFLINHEVSLPSVAKAANLRWSTDQLSSVLRELAPYAEVAEARLLRKLIKVNVHSWARGGYLLMQRSDLPEVARIGRELELLGTEPRP